MKLYKIASFLYVILGTLHLIAHYAGNLHPDKATLTVMHQMASHPIRLLGTHNLLQFHTGFSLMMGFLLAAFGFQQLLGTESIRKTQVISAILISAVALTLSICYFHLLATAFILASLLLHLLAYVNLRRKDT